MKEAIYYKKLRDKQIKCTLCPHNCVLSDGKTGICRVRKNIDGSFYSLVYEKPIKISAGPIEKKYIYHFYPGTNVLSIGTAGANLKGPFCKEFKINSLKIDADFKNIKDISPQEVIDLCKEKNCESIIYDYNEPTIFYEYMLDIAKLAKTEGIKNIIVSNGFINEDPLKELVNYIDAANIELKSFKPSFYKNFCNGKLAPVLRTLNTLKENNVWVEITFSIIPGYTDSEDEIKQISSWIKENLGGDTPLHLSKFIPNTPLKKVGKLSEKKLFRLKEIAENDLDYVYVENVDSNKGYNTYCPSCGKLLIGRSIFGIISNKISNNKCSCGKRIPGKF